MEEKNKRVKAKNIPETEKNIGVEIYNSKLHKKDDAPIDVPLSFWNEWHVKNPAAELGEPSFSFTVVVNKVDSIVHAGNAALILEWLKNYNGGVEMFVLRPESKTGRVLLEKNPDDIWAREVRNGEKMLFDFFGPVPSQEFLKELSIRVNKYTQMDKIVS